MGSGSFPFGSGWVSSGLVVAGCVDGELAEESSEEFACGGVDDAGVQGLDEHEDGGAEHLGPLFSAASGIALADVNWTA